METTNLKEALQYVVETAKPEPKIITVGDRTYSSEQMYEVASPEVPELTVKPVSVTTLTSFVDYVNGNIDGLVLSKTMVQITGPKNVQLISVPNAQCLRNSFIAAAAETPEIHWGRWYDTEDFNILMQSSFMKTADRDTLLKYASNIKDEEAVVTADDGIGQRVAAKTGVATVENVILPNPVTLQPYRTFQEIEQPESEFVFRIRKGGQCALFEADGGMWKIQCRQAVKKFLAENLPGDIVILG